MVLLSLALTVMVLGLGGLTVVVMVEGTLEGEGSMVVVLVILQECWQVFEVTKGAAQSSTGLLKLQQAIEVGLASPKRGRALLAKQGVGLPMIEQTS